MTTVNSDASYLHRQILEFLFDLQTRNAPFPAELLEQIAGSRLLLEELAQVSVLLTGEDSMLKSETASLLTCQECLDALPSYVEAQVNGTPVEEQYPIIYRHLKTCADCREEAELLYQLEAELLQATTSEAPTYRTFGDWYADRSTSATEISMQQFSATLWQETVSKARHLMEEIEIRIADAQAIFGDISTNLTPQVASQAAFRNSPTSEEGQEFLELPSPETNFLLSIRLGPVFAGITTLILETKMLVPNIPIADAEISLRGEYGELLETALSDQNGLAFFRSLELGKYQLLITHDERSWELTINLRAME